MHKCPRPGCQASVRFDHFACPRHWRSLPRSIKHGILEAWRLILSGDDAAVDEHEHWRNQAALHWKALG